MHRERPYRQPAIRRSLALLVGAAVTAFVATCAYSTFEPVRQRLIKGPVSADAGAVEVRDATDASNRLPVTPFAVIAVFAHEAGMRTHFQLLLDDQPICQVASSVQTSTRMSCVAHSVVPNIGVHHIVVRGPASAWSLTYLELATHFGSTRSFVDLYVVPDGSRAYNRTSLVTAVTVGTLVTGLLLLPATGWPRRLRIAHGLVLTVIAVLFLLIVTLPLVSSYVCVISLKTTLLLLALALAPPITWVAGSTRSLTDRWAFSRGPFVHACVIGAAVGGAYGVIVAARVQDAHGNSSALLQISRSIFDHSPLVSQNEGLRQTLVLHEGEGYDGQFMYFAALDPLLSTFKDRPEQYLRVIDAPAYRYGRGGFFLLADAVTLGHSALLPAAMVWIPVFGVALAALVLARIGQLKGGSPAVGLLVLLVPGFWQSVQATLPEPLAAGLLLCGYVLLIRRRVELAGLAFAASLLVRETGLIFVLIAGWMSWRLLGLSAAVRLVLIAVIPVIAWRAYVGWALFPVLGAEAFYQNPRNVTLPFRGFLDFWGQMWRGVYAEGDPGLNRAALWYPIVVIVGLLVSLRLAWRQRTPLALALLAYATLAVSLDYPSIWVFTGNGQRGTYELFVMLALVTATTFQSMSRMDRTFVRTFWVLAGAFILFGSFDAAYVRDALF